jgi:general secretion pathway protein N
VRRAVARTVARSASAPWGWALAGALVGLVVSLALFAPARWLAAGVQRATADRLVLAYARGTVWNGSAQLMLTGGAGSNDTSALPGRIEWRLRPRFDGIVTTLTAACCVPQPLAIEARWRWGGGALRIADGRSQWPAVLLAGLGTPWNTLQLDGDLQVSTQGLSVEWSEGRLALAGRCELVAQRMSSRLSTLRPMGSYRILVQGGSTPTLRLETLEGALQLSGDGQWVGSRLRFSGVAQAAPEREAALANLLNIIGRRSGPRSLISIG